MQIDNAAADNRIFFRRFASGFKIQQSRDNEMERNEITMCRILPGFLQDFTMFFANENKLFKIQ